MKLIGKNLKFISVSLLMLAAGLLKAGTCQAAARAYITDSGDNTVSVIDVISQTAANPLSGFNRPYGVAIAPAGDFLYVTNLGDNTVARVELATGQQVTCPTGLGPLGVAVSPDGGKVFVAARNLASPGLGVVSFPGCSKEDIIFNNAPKGPFGVAVHPGGALLYMTDEVGDQLQVVDLTTNTAEEALPVGVDPENFPGPHRPRGVAISPNGTYVVVANSFSNSVSIFSTSDNSAKMVAVGASPFGVVVGFDNLTAYVTNQNDDTVSALKLDSGTVTATIPVGDASATVADGPKGIAVTPDGKLVYVVNNLSGTVSVIDTATNTVTATLPVGVAPEGFGKFIGGPVPAAPTGMQATLLGDTAIKLSWIDNASSELGYKLERRKYVQGGYVTIATLPPDTTSFTDNSGLDSDTNYYYRVKAFNDVGDSAYSNESYAMIGSEDYGCFIATAAYGSLLEPHVVLLRVFRDHFLTGNRPGRAFLRFYYENSPPLARFIAAHDFLRFLVRWSLLPLVGFSWLALTIGLLPALACLVLAPAMLAGLRLYHRKGQENAQPG